MQLRIIDREEIQAILTQDSHYRKNQKWPLLTSKSIGTINHHKNVDVIGMINVKLEHGYNLIVEEIVIDMSKFTLKINEKYKFTNEILHKFHGNLVASGGCVVSSLIDTNPNNRSLQKATKHSDLDLFFYNLTVEQANKMRISVICEIIYNWKYRSNYDVKFIIKRNEFVTSVYVFNCYNNKLLVEYQLIHRIYPDISSIIGGFDIGACMLAYDGYEIYTTPLGAWTLRNRSIIVDTKRRSTSYEHRLVKYFKRTFRIIFPGLPDEEIYYKKVIGSSSESEDALKSKIFNLVKNSGYKINNIDKIMNECSKIQKLSNDNLSTDNLVIICGYQNLELSLTRYNNKSLTEKALVKISDYYNDSDMNFYQFIKANLTKLRLNNLKSVSSLIVIDNDEIISNIYNLLVEDIDHPNIQLNDTSIIDYKNEIDHIRSNFNRHRSSWSYNAYFYDLVRKFGNLTNEVLNLKDVNEINNYGDLMITIMHDNAKICEEKLTGIKWITENPGRQWTSSINPIIANPREWYGENYIPVVTGIPIEIELCLRLMRLPRIESYWSYLPTEIFNLILFYINKNYADKAWRYLTL
jgi:hypothetical protein